MIYQEVDFDETNFKTHGLASWFLCHSNGGGVLLVDPSSTGIPTEDGMIQQLLRNCLESRSLMDLLFIWAGYSAGWSLHIFCAHWLVNYKATAINRLCAGLLLGAVCLLIKGYLPFIYFEIVIILLMTCALKLTGISILKAFTLTLVIDVFVLIDDITIIQCFLHIPNAAHFITQTSRGLALSTLLEPIASIVLIFLWKKGLKKWKKIKYKNL